MGINVLSLFDGISCGQVALERVGIKVDNYFASEINSKSIWITQNNYPDTIQIGDIKKVKSENLPKIDLLMGGSPCQDFSQYKAGYGLGIDGEKSKLFKEFLRLLIETKPKYFLLENVPMKKEWEDLISEKLGIEPLKIDSGLICAGDRKRLYWTNIPILDKLKEKQIVLRDILQDAKEVEEKYWYNKKFEFHGENKKVAATLILKGHRHMKEVYSKNFKTNTLTTCNGGNIQKKVYQDGKCRKITPLEYERIQTLPDNYTKGVADIHRYNGCGDGWTIDVIAHIFKGLLELLRNDKKKKNKRI
jgi:DNA (cytosine-5)-methyltransferase 3A